jgi:hypothetical protein
MVPKDLLFHSKPPGMTPTQKPAGLAGGVDEALRNAARYEHRRVERRFFDFIADLKLERAFEHVRIPARPECTRSGGPLSAVPIVRNAVQ